MNPLLNHGVILGERDYVYIYIYIHGMIYLIERTMLQHLWPNTRIFFTCQHLILSPSILSRNCWWWSPWWTNIATELLKMAMEIVDLPMKKKCDFRNFNHSYVNGYQRYISPLLEFHIFTIPSGNQTWRENPRFHPGASPATPHRCLGEACWYWSWPWMMARKCYTVVKPMVWIDTHRHDVMMSYMSVSHILKFSSTKWILGF